VTPAIRKLEVRVVGILPVTLSLRAGTKCFTGATGSECEALPLRLGPKGATSIWIGFDQRQVIAPKPRLKALLFPARLSATIQTR
jgi:hypothetical protein